MEDEKATPKYQTFFLIATGILGIMVMWIGIAYFMLGHMLRGITIVFGDLVLVSLPSLIIDDDEPDDEDLDDESGYKPDNEKPDNIDLGTEIFTMHNITVALDGMTGREADATLMSGGIYIEGISRRPIKYSFDNISMFSSDEPTEFSFAVKMQQSVTLSNVKRLHVKALAEAFHQHGIQEVANDISEQ